MNPHALAISALARGPEHRAQWSSRDEVPTGGVRRRRCRGAAYPGADQAPARSPFTSGSRGSQGRFREHGARPAARGPPTGLDGFGTAIVTILCRELDSRDAEHLVLGHRQDHSRAPMLGWMSNANRWPSSKTTVMEIRSAVTSTGAPPDPDGLHQFLLLDVVDVLMRLLAWPRRNGPTWPPESHRSMERNWRRMDGVGCGNGNEWHLLPFTDSTGQSVIAGQRPGPVFLDTESQRVQIL